MPWPFRRDRARDEAPPGALDEFVVLIDDRLDPRLVVYHAPESLHAEQYRGFRTNLRAMNPGDQPRSLLFTSAEPGVGKSVSLANIALALTEFADIRVCLVDADIRVCRPPDGCSNLDNKCETAADCCNPRHRCIGGFCAELLQ
jgi:hypothetical protein